MGFVDAIKSAKAGVKGLRGLAGLLDPSQPAIADELSEIGSSADDYLWQINGEDWYKVFGYQFIVTVVDDSALDAKKQAAKSLGGLGALADKVMPSSETSTYFYTLPIPPQSIIIKPVMASRVTPTIGGVVEETSPVTFWMISLSGTTGTGVGRGDGDIRDKTQMATLFRDKITTTGILSSISNGLNSAIGQYLTPVDQLISGAQDTIDAIKSGNLAAAADSAINGVTGALNNAFTPPPMFAASAVGQTSNGFTEAQDLLKFFYVYQKLKGTRPEKYNLYFDLHKTSQSWQVIVRDFSLQQSAQNPMLYRYNIVLQGWECESVDADDRLVTNRFGANGDLSPVNTVSPNSKNPIYNASRKLTKALNKFDLAL